MVTVAGTPRHSPRSTRGILPLGRMLWVVGLLTLFVLTVRTTFFLGDDDVGSLWTSSRSTSIVLPPTNSFPSRNSVNSLRASHTGSKYQDDQCRFYLAESAIPFGGLGVFTAVGLHPGDTVGIEDICIFVPDMKAKEREWKQMRSHTWGKGNYFGQYEGKSSRAACEGMVTTFNTMPDRMVNTKVISPYLPTNAGVDRTKPSAGSITHHFGIHGEALDIITAGSELTVNYGDWDFDESIEYKKPERSVGWLQQNGWCIDNIDIRTSTIPDAGRGAFAKRPMAAGEVVAPAPLQSFADRSVFQDSNPEQLYVNYCLQPKNSKMLFFPYGQGVNLINHSRENPNVYLRWSTNPMHHADWLKMSLQQYWQVSKSGGIILDVVALRDIQPNEELFLDYGEDWDRAWKEHVQKWKPSPDAMSYTYPADMDETQPLRTVKEQETNPYPSNLATMCSTPDWSRRPNNRTIDWYEVNDWPWWQGMTYCNILEREKGPTGNPVYTVELLFKSRLEQLVHDPSKPRSEMYIDQKVPRKAIRFIEKPYMDDEHILNAFRHPIGMPDELFPEHWKAATAMA